MSYNWVPYEMCTSVCFTVTDPDIVKSVGTWNMRENTDGQRITYYIYMVEKDSVSGKPVIRGYAERLGRLGKIGWMRVLGSNSSDIRPGRDSADSVVSSCKKEVGRLKGPWEWGNRSVTVREQGSRTAPPKKDLLNKTEEWGDEWILEKIHGGWTYVDFVKKNIIKAVRSKAIIYDLIGAIDLISDNFI